MDREKRFAVVVSTMLAGFVNMTVHVKEVSLWLFQQYWRGCKLGAKYVVRRPIKGSPWLFCHIALARVQALMA